MLTTPLQIALLYHPQGTLVEGMRAGLLCAFEGAGEGYLAGANDTGVPVLEFTAPPMNAPLTDSAPGQTAIETLLSRAAHSVVVVILTKALADIAAWQSCLRDMARATSGDQSNLILLDIDDCAPTLPDWDDMKDAVTRVPLDALGERAIRNTVAGLVVLHHAIRTLSDGSATLLPKLTLFLSHAKLDGTSLAAALTQLIATLPDFNSFYDARDIPPGADVEKILRESVQSSVLIVLRSDLYETRAWCLQEMRWAEHYSAPYIVADLRTRMITGPAKAGFDQAPTVWLPDGNLHRIVFMALRESLHARLHVRRVELLEAELLAIGAAPTGATYVPLIRAPSIMALQAVIRAQGTAANVQVVYPDPRLPAAEDAAARAFLQTRLPGARLTTPQSLVLTAHHPKNGTRP